MAVNLGEAFVALKPNWDGITQHAINEQLARLTGTVKIDGDTRPLTQSATKTASAIESTLSKSLKDGITSGGKAAESEATSAGERVSRGWLKSLGPSLGGKVSESLTKGVKEATQSSIDNIQRLQNANDVATRRMTNAAASQQYAFQRVERTQEAATAAMKEFGAGSEEAGKAMSALQRAQDQAERASRRVDSAEKKLSQTQKDLATEISKTKWNFGGVNFEPLVRKMGIAGKDAGAAFDREARESMKKGMTGFNPMAGMTVKGAVGAVAGAAGVMGVGSFVKGSFDLAADFQKQLSSIQAVSGATQDQMQKISDKSMELGAQTKYSTTEAASAIEELVKAGLSVPDALGGAAKATTSLAAAGEVPLDEAATQISNVKNAFQLASKDMPRVADLISGAANASSIDVKDFGYSMSASASVAHQAGMSVDDTSKAIAELGNMGLKGSDAGTSLKTLINNFQPTGNGAALAEQYGIEALDQKGAQAALKANHIALPKNVDASSIGGFQKALTMYYEKHDHEAAGEAKMDAKSFMGENQLVNNVFFDKNGKFLGLRNAQAHLNQSFGHLSDKERVSATQQIFGTDAERAAGDLAVQGTKGYDNITQGMGKVTADQTAAIRQQNFTSAKEQFNGSLENVRIKMATPALGISTAAINAATAGLNVLARSGQGVSKMVAEFNKAFPNFHKQLDEIGLGAEKFGKLLLQAFSPYLEAAVKGITGAIGGVLMPVLAKTFTELGNHGGALAKVIALLVSSFVAFRAGVMLGNGAMKAWDTATKVASTSQKLFNGALSAGRGILTGVKWAWSIAQTLAHRAATLAARGAQLLWNAAQAAGRGILTGFRWAWSIAQTLAHRAATMAARGAQLLWNAAQKIGQGLLAGVKWAWSIAQTLAHRGATLAARSAQLLWNAAQKAGAAALAGVKWLWSIAMMAAHRAASLAGAAAQKAMAAAQWLVNTAMEANPIGLVIAALVALVAALVIAWKHSDTFRSVVMGAWHGIKSAASEVWDWLSGTLWPGLSKFFTQQIPGAMRTFTSAFGAAWDSLKDLAKKPINFVIGTVINGLIGGFDKVSGLVHGPNIPKLPTLQTGGIIPGQFDPAHRDNVLGVSSKGVPHVRVEPGEFVTNRKSTRKYGPLLRAINEDSFSQGSSRPNFADHGTVPAGLPGLKEGGVAGVMDWEQSHIASHSGGWHERCLAAVNAAWREGGGVSVPWLGVDWAIHAWDAAPRKHPGDANPPAGAAVWFNTGSKYKHITTSVGNGMVASTDWPDGSGHIGVAGISQLASAWNAPLIGWASPEEDGTVGTAKVKAIWNYLSGKIGSAVDYVAELGDKFAGPLGKLKQIKNTPMGQLAAGFPMMLVDKMKSIINKLNPFSSGDDSSDVGSAANPGGSGVERWRSTISQALAANGLPTSDDYVNAWLRQVATESGGNPTITQQIHDVNSGGNEAQGLLQVIPPTFRAYEFPGHGDIHNGLDNALAAINYAKHNYGSRMLDVIGHGHGYSTGVKSAAPGWAMIDERGDEWVNFNGGETVLPHGTTPKAGPQVLTGQITITNWDKGLGTFAGQIHDEMDWRAAR